MKLLFALIATAFVSQAHAVTNTDFSCVQRCTASGNQYGLCQSRCSYEVNTSLTLPSLNAPLPQTDYGCVSRCTQSGSGYAYCKSSCSY